MSSLSHTIHPSTLDEIQASFRDWWRSLAKGDKIPISFSASPKSAKRLRLSAPTTKDIKLEIDQRTISWQDQKHRLSIVLDGFDVRTEFEGQRLFVDIEPLPMPRLPSLELALRSVANTKYPVFASRVLRVLSSLEEDLTTGRIEEATAAPTDYLVIVNALSSSSLASQSAGDDPLAEAKLRGLKRKQELVEAAGGVFSSERVAELLGITRQAVDKRRAQNQLVALTQGRRGYGYPAFQFADGKTTEGLEEVLKALKAFDPWMQLAFFVTPNDRLGGSTPTQALRASHRSDVLRAARSYGEQGAA
jgi:hypothetical protein